MPRTVPTVDGSGQRKSISVRWIDANNQKRADTLQLDQLATNAQIEAIIAALAAASNGNIYEVLVTEVYADVANSGDATEAPRESIRDNIVMLFKNATTADGRDYFIPAPLDTLFLGGTNTVDVTDPLVLAVRDAIDAAVTGYEPVSVRFTERRKKNPSRSL